MTPDGGAARSLAVVEMLGVAAEASTLSVAAKALETGLPNSPVMALWAGAARLDGSAVGALAAVVLVDVIDPIGFARGVLVVVAPGTPAAELETELAALHTRTEEGACTAHSRRPLRSTRSEVRSRAVGDIDIAAVDVAQVNTVAVEDDVAGRAVASCSDWCAVGRCAAVARRTAVRSWPALPSPSSAPA